MRPAHQENAFVTRVLRKPPLAEGRKHPFTIIEFSLTNDRRNEIKQALDPYLKANTPDIAYLTTIIENHLPKEIIHELKTLHRKNAATHTVYVIRNLPELPPEELIKTIDPKQQKKGAHWQDQINTHCYSPHILTGLFEVIGLRANSQKIFPLLRFENDFGSYTGRYGGTGGLHKDYCHINGLGGIISDQSKTRFTDWTAVLEDMEKYSSRFDPFSPDRAYLTIQPNCTGQGEKQENIFIKASQFKTAFPNWQEDIGMGMNPIYAIKDIKGNQEAARNFNKLIDKHSFDIEATPGSLLIWNNAGAIFHTGHYVPGYHKAYSAGETAITRAVIPHIATRMR